MAAASSSLNHTKPGGPVQQLPQRVQENFSPSLNHADVAMAIILTQVAWACSRCGLRCALALFLDSVSEQNQTPRPDRQRTFQRLFYFRLMEHPTLWV